jgi:hypothetical protein
MSSELARISFRCSHPPHRAGRRDRGAVGGTIRVDVDGSAEELADDELFGTARTKSPRDHARQARSVI